MEGREGREWGLPEFEDEVAEGVKGEGVEGKGNGEKGEGG